MQGNEATRVDNGDIERKSDENEKLPIEQQSVIKNQGVMQIPNYEILGRFRAPLQIVISLLIWTYSMEELLNIFDHFTKK